MKLIAEGGSTKCDWVLLDTSGGVLLKTQTLGLNPNVVPEDALFSRINSNPELSAIFNQVQELDFYGAGCGTITPRQTLHNVLQKLFARAKITVADDMLAAALAVTNAPGIVCILGTGSNSCYFDGKKTKTQVESLGYSIMDEASGNHFGKQLIRDYFYKKMPDQLANKFEQRFDLNPDTIKINLYKNPNPNAYLASFAEFIFTENDSKNYFYQLIREGILDFIEKRVLSYEMARQTPIHFVGTVAHFSKDIILQCLQKHHLKPGNIVKRPIDGLIEHYRKNKLNQ